jgi:hypothetical protein
MQNPAIKALDKACRERDAAHAKVASLEVAKKQLIEDFDRKISAAKLDILTKNKNVEIATNAVVSPKRNEQTVEHTVIPRFADRVSSNGVAH